MFKLKVDKPKKFTAVEPGTIDPVHEIPSLKKGGKEVIDLSMFDEWDGLSVPQKRYLVEFSKQHMKKKRAALAAMVSIKSLEGWLHSDENFISIYESIIDLHVEAVEEMDYHASFDSRNNTSRGRFLDKRSKLYREHQEPSNPAPRIGEQTNILAVLNSADVTDKGLAGVQKMFNSLKEQGKLPKGMEVGQDKS